MAIRNRWRRQQLTPELRQDVTPKNIILIGPTGVGKPKSRAASRHSSARRSSRWRRPSSPKSGTSAATSRASSATSPTKPPSASCEPKCASRCRKSAKQRVSERLLDLLVPAPKNSPWEPEQEKEEAERRQRTRDKMKAKLDAGELEDRVVELTVEQKSTPVQIFSNLGMENMDVDLQGMFDKMMPKNTPAAATAGQGSPKGAAGTGNRVAHRPRAVIEQAVERSRITASCSSTKSTRCAAPSASQHGPDVSRQGVHAATCCRSSKVPPSTRSTAR